MTFRQFISARFAERRARRAHKAMFRVYGESWARNAAGVVDLLVSPSPVYVLDVEMLRGVVAEALATSAVAEKQAINPFSAEPVYGGEPERNPSFEMKDSAEESFPVEPVAEADEPSPLRDAIFESPRANGVEAVPVRPDLNNDERRRAFIANFLREQRVPVTSNQPMRS